MCGWAMLLSDSGRVTLWCMLQAGLSNHFVGILDDRASDALFLDLVSSHFARVWGPCLVLRGFHFDRGAHVRCRCVQPLCLEIRVWLGHVVECLWPCDSVVHAPGRCVKPCCRDSG